MFRVGDQAQSLKLGATLEDGSVYAQASTRSDIVTLPQGERLISTDDVGSEMYVVVDGELQASIMRKDGRVPLSTHSRGDTIGEVGLFHAKRTADVDVVENARLLRLTQDSLERLRRRSPRVAAQVNWNLNKILAERVANTTDRLR